MSREAYKVTLIDDENAFIFLECIDEDDWDVVDRLIGCGHPPYVPFTQDDLNKARGQIWKFTIQIGATELYGRGGPEKRHALKKAWERLEQDEGIKPGTTIERV